MKLLQPFSILMVSLVLTSNASAEKIQSDSEYKNTYSIDQDIHEVYDPYEKLNRKIFAFNSVLDHFMLRPVAIFYKNITNDYVKARVGSFTDNVNMPLTVVNYGLQLKFDHTMKSLWRFLINSTLGVGGLFDVASKLNLNPTRQTLGSTFARYGVGPGPYLVIPFFGSTNARDVTDNIYTNNALNPLKYQFHKDFKLGFTGVKLVHDRAIALPFTDHITKTSTDPYVAIRSAIHQNRESKIKYPKGYEPPQTPSP
jgi:phospholipid-binding lipoprotein MlaA